MSIRFIQEDPSSQDASESELVDHPHDPSEAPSEKRPSTLYSRKCLDCLVDLQELDYLHETIFTHCPVCGIERYAYESYVELDAPALFVPADGRTQPPAPGSSSRSLAALKKQYGGRCTAELPAALASMTQRSRYTGAKAYTTTMCDSDVWEQRLRDVQRSLDRLPGMLFVMASATRPGFMPNLFFHVGDADPQYFSISLKGKLVNDVSDSTSSPEPTPTLPALLGTNLTSSHTASAKQEASAKASTNELAAETRSNLRRSSNMTIPQRSCASNVFNYPNPNIAQHAPPPCSSRPLHNADEESKAQCKCKCHKSRQEIERRQNESPTANRLARAKESREKAKQENDRKRKEAESQETSQATTKKPKLRIVTAVDEKDRDAGL